MIKSLVIGKLTIDFVFRHKWDSDSKSLYGIGFRGYEVGFWFKRDKMVGRKDFNKPSCWGSNHVNSYTFGLKFFVCKAWICWDVGGMHLNVD